VSADNGTSLLGEWQTYKAPFLFSSNGRPFLEQIKTKSGVWFLDVRAKENTARPLQAWFSPIGLQQLYQQDIADSNKKLASDSPDFLRSKNGLWLRDYQITAIEKVEEAIINDKGGKRRRWRRANRDRSASGGASGCSPTRKDPRARIAGEQLPWSRRSPTCCAPDRGAAG